MTISEKEQLQEKVWILDDSEVLKIIIQAKPGRTVSDVVTDMMRLGCDLGVDVEGRHNDSSVVFEYEKIRDRLMSEFGKAKKVER